MSADREAARGKTIARYAEHEGKHSRIPCVVQLGGMSSIGSTDDADKGYMIFLRLDGGCDGNPSLALNFEANTVKDADTERPLTSDRSKISWFMIKWFPGPVHSKPSTSMAQMTYTLKDFRLQEKDSH